MFLFAPFFALLLVIADGLADYIENAIVFNILMALIVIIVMSLVFKVTEGMPQIRDIGECRIDEQGRCFIVKGRRITILSDVKEVSAWRKAVVGSRYVQLIIRSSDGRKVKLFGWPMGPGDRMADDDLIRLEGFILRHYPGLRQMTNMRGEPIDYWYRR